MPSLSPAPKQQPSKSGMSLLEVILAIAVAGFVLAAAISMLVSISNIWSDRAERHFFVDHVDGVTEFLNATFTTAGIQISTNDSATETDTEDENDDEGNTPNNPGDIVIQPPTAGDDTTKGDETNTTNSSSGSGGLISTSDEPVAWASPPGFADYKEPLLNFQLSKPPPILIGLNDAPLLGLEIYLYFEKNEGLSLLWHSTLQEETEDIKDLRRTTISPLVTDIHYVYWDESFEKWETEDEPKKGDRDDQYILPRFIKLTFEYKGETQERTFTIPVPSKSALIY